MVYNVIQSSSAVGMQSLDSCLRKLVQEKMITGNEAYEKAVNKQDFVSLCEQE
jgi:Tfp pilus assembly pilus retraction ATPase PilT